ncbi:MAG: hypothetical protein WB615_14195 [Candidatus Tumulicola sp.]
MNRADRPISKTRNHRFLAACAAAAILAGCAGRESEMPFAPSGTSAPASASPTSILPPALDARCKAMAQNFDETVACQRANGTLLALADPKIAWRVRYFVRYWEMPCNEFPTEDEGYVFNAVTNDLYTDPDISNTQRIQIRNAMFDGQIHCK